MSGYTNCPCRDCFEISIDGALCSECKEAECSADGDAECDAPGAYGGDDYERDESPDEPDEEDWVTTDPHHDCNQIWAEMADPSCYDFETFEEWHAENCVHEEEP